MMDIIFMQNKEAELNIFPLDEEGAIMYDVQTEYTHILNETAVFLYQLLEKPMKMPDILDSFRKEYQFENDDISTLEDDLWETLNILEEKNLIKTERDKA
jgi:hypothetical protein